MYRIDVEQLRKGRKKLNRLLQQSGRAPIVVPLGRDANHHWLYCVIVFRLDNTISLNVVSVGRSGVNEIAGCTCDAGSQDNHCYHFAAAYPVHRTFVFVEHDATVMASLNLERSKRHVND